MLGDWLYAGIRAAILHGRLRRGHRVPSTRDLAAHYSISRGVVVAAYARLHDEGYLVSRSGSGTVVNESVYEDYQVPSKPSAAEPAQAKVAARPRVRPFCPIEPAVSEFPMALWARLGARSARPMTARDLSRGDPAGSRALRESIAGYLGVARGVTCSAERVVVSGAQQAFDLAARILIRPGDAVWMEDPGYRGAVDASSSGAE
jgi:GntR family transcriptional regulator/MocR family aminotransferase